MTTLNGQVALVTGAVGGTGQAICAALRDAGARLALADLDKSALDQAVDDLGPGTDAAAFDVDLADDEQTTALPDRVRRHFGGLDVVVNNAGVRQIAPLLELSPPEWRQDPRRRPHRPLVLARAAIPGMLNRASGKIINIASMAGHLAFQNRAA